MYASGTAVALTPPRRGSARSNDVAAAAAAAAVLDTTPLAIAPGPDNVVPVWVPPPPLSAPFDPGAAAYKFLSSSIVEQDPAAAVGGTLSAVRFVDGGLTVPLLLRRRSCRRGTLLLPITAVAFGEFVLSVPDSSPPSPARGNSLDDCFDDLDVGLSRAAATAADAARLA